MKKKITILIITFLIILGTTNAATLTQKIGTGFIRALVQAGEQITLKFVNNGTANFNNWVEETSTGVLDGIDATNTQISFTMPASDVTIKADYGEAGGETEPDQQTQYTLTYNAKGGSGAPTRQTKTTTSSATFTISSTKPTRSGYTFLGWSKNSSPTISSYAAGDCITITADTTLYAVWEHTITLTYDANGGSGAPDSESVTTTSVETFSISSIEPTPPSGKAFRGWAKNSSATKADYKIGTRISVGSNTTLYAVYVTPLSNGDLLTEADVGAYVAYTPSSTSYTVARSVSGVSSQIYNPCEVKSWRVFSNNGSNIEIISTDSIGDLKLKGKTGYINAVQTLQDLSSAYVNSTYATSGRNLGYSEEGLTAEEIENYKVIDTNTYPLNDEVSGFPYDDTQSSSDETVIDNNRELLSNDAVWLASRYSSSGTFGLMALNNALSYSSKKSEYPYLYYGFNDDSFELGVRPVITLKSGIKITGGDGSPSNPYTIGI